MEVDDYEELEKQWNKIHELTIAPISAIKKNKIKKGYNEVGEKVDSFSEYAFIKYMRNYKGFIVERNQTDWLPYYDDDGKSRKFYYDFICNGQKCEVKGRVTRTDQLKQEQNTDVVFYYQDQINLMIKEMDKTIGKAWRNDFIQTN